MKRFLVSFLFVYSFVLHSAIRFYEGQQGVQTMQEFILQVVSPSDHVEFNLFYHEVNDKHRRKRLDVRQRARARLQQLAMQALEVKKPEWAIVITKNRESKAAQMFLTRYGILEEYYQYQAQKTGSIRSKIVSFGKTIANKASKTVSFFKRTK